MRIYFHLTPNTEPVPFNYQAALVGAFHRWLGENELHDDISLYSLSWLEGGQKHKKGLNFPDGARFFISAPDETLLQNLISGVFAGTHIRWGMNVEELRMRVTPNFGARKYFWVQSPVFIKRRTPDLKDQFYFPGDDNADLYLTQTLQHKLTKYGLSPNVSVKFDPEYRNPKGKMIVFKGISLKASYCPVIVEGASEAVSFAWNVGIGNSTGIGFGALR